MQRIDADKLRFVCDEMFQGLARWLRAAGYDTLLPPRGTADREVVALAARGRRWLVTRDRKICEIGLARGRVVLLEDDGLTAAAAELSRRLGVDWLHDPFSRCLLCNTPLQRDDATRWPQVPEDLRRERGEVRYCPNCTKPYWKGGHVRRMRARLQALSRA